MKKAILYVIFVVAWLSLFLVPDTPDTWFFVTYPIRLAVWVISGRAIDTIDKKERHETA